MCSSSKVGGLDINLKNFKIPKQNNKLSTTNVTTTSPKSKTTIQPKIIKSEPETLMTILTDHFSGSCGSGGGGSIGSVNLTNKIQPSLLSHCESPSLSISSVNSQNEYAPTSSSSSSPSLNTQACTFDFNNQKSTNYYHPKKSQFRQYMMESSSTTTVINDTTTTITTNTSGSLTTNTTNNINANTTANTMASDVKME